MWMKSLFLSLALFVGALAGAAETKLSVAINQQDGLKIISDTTGEIVLATRQIVVEPPWAAKWFYNGTSPLNFTNNGNFAKIEQKPDNGDKFDLAEYSATVDGNTVTIKFRGKMKEDLPAAVEYTMLVISDFLLADTTYVATHYDSATSSGTISASPLNSAAPFITGVMKVEFSGALGRVVVESTPDLLFSVADRRGSAVFAPGQSGFWIGHMSRTLPFGEEYNSVIKFTYEPSDTAVIPKPIGAPAPTFPLTPERFDRIPRKAAAGVDLPTYMPIPKVKKITGTIDDKSVSRFSAGEFTNVPEEDVVRLTKAIDTSAYALHMKKPITRPVNVELVERAEEGALANDEGYILEVTRKAANITAVTPRGTFYAIQSLNAMPLDQTYRIEDYPDLPFRSVHLLAAEETADFHSWMVDNIFTRYKYNAIVLEVEYVQWDTVPNLWQPRSLTKANLKKFLDHCKDNYIEVIPLFQTLGHLEWFFYKGQNLEMAEDPSHPYAYNPSHPGVYPIMDAIMEEIFELFDSEYIHIGHDEVDMYGVFPKQPENVAKGFQQVVIDDIMHYYDMCKERGKRIMIWHDMILSPGECPNASGMHVANVKETCRDLLPRDIVIADWQYSGNQAHAHYKDVKLLMDEGFDVIGCTWYDTNNVENFTKAVYNYGAMGMMGTTWTGYFSGWDSFDRAFYQMATYPRLGAWAWTVSDENYEHGNFHNVLVDIVSAYGRPNRRTVDITPVANIFIDESSNPFLRGHVYDLPKFLLSDNLTVGDIEFKVPVVDGKLAAITTRSALNRDFPRKVVLPVAAYAKQLYFLHSHIDVTTPEFDQQVIAMTLVYRDGSRAVIPFLYGRDIGTLFGEATMRLTPANCIKLNDGARLWYTRQPNPYPDREIASIEIEGAGLPYYLFGLSIE